MVRFMAFSSFPLLRYLGGPYFAGLYNTVIALSLHWSYILLRLWSTDILALIFLVPVGLVVIPSVG